MTYESVIKLYITNTRRAVGVCLTAKHLNDINYDTDLIRTRKMFDKVLKQFKYWSAIKERISSTVDLWICDNIKEGSHFDLKVHEICMYVIRFKQKITTKQTPKKSERYCPLFCIVAQSLTISYKPNPAQPRSTPHLSGCT